jgi:endonuclease/exonuclease/phosphatase family metal-dependent hydrolase
LPFGIISALALILSYFSGMLNPGPYWPFAFISLLFPYLYLLCLLLAGLGLVLKNHKAWILVVLLVLMSTLFRRSFFNITVNAASSSGITIVSHNIGSSISGTQPGNWSFYQNTHADIFCFQEWLGNSITLKNIKDSLIRKYNSTLSLDQNPWPIFTSYPIINQGEINSSAKGNGATWADILYKKDTIRIYNVHLVSNRISGQTENLIANANHPNGNTLQKITRVLRRYKNALIQRTAQAEELRRHIGQTRYPVILAGDFNDIPSSFVFRLLSKHMKDAWLHAGNGMAYTYAGRLPFLHIDHILTKGKIEAIDFEISRVNYSDHYPVMSRLKIGD